MTTEFQVSLDEGKYTYERDDDGQQRALRHGEPWRDLVGDKFVAAMGYEIERLRAELATEKTKHHYTALAAHAEAQEVNQLNAELAASQAHIEKLRGVLAYAARCLDTDGNDPVIDAPLTLPHDNTALKERLRQERERCAKYFEDRAERYLQDHAFGADMNYHADLLEYAEAIRNLGDEA